jgi:hypothetical protein
VPQGALAETILTFAAIVAVGVALRATGLLRAQDVKPLNSVIVYVGLPAFVFQAVRGAELDADVWRVVAVSWAVFAVLWGAAWLLSLTRAGDRPRRGAFLLVATLGNTGYIGYPVAAAVLGASAVPLAVFSDVFGTVLALVLVGIPVAARFGSGERTRVNVFRELLRFPAVPALLAGLLWRFMPIWDSVSSGLDLLASMVAPLVMLSVGIALRPRALIETFADVSLVAVLRLAVAPLLALVIGGLWLDGDPLRVTALQAGMPAMMLTLVVGERFGLDTDLIASAIFVTTILSAITIPLVQSVIL